MGWWIHLTAYKIFIFTYLDQWLSSELMEKLTHRILKTQKINSSGSPINSQYCHTPALVESWLLLRIALDKKKYDCGFRLSALWFPLSAPTILLGFLLPWTGGISSRLLQQSSAAAPYLGRRASPLRRWLLQCRAATSRQSSNTWTGELPDVQAGFRKGRETRDQIANILWIIEKAREFQKKNLLHWLC